MGGDVQVVYVPVPVVPNVASGGALKCHAALL
jgi:hypothetical protein